MDALVALAPLAASHGIFASGMISATADGWRPLAESTEKQTILMKKLRAWGHDILADTLDFPGMAARSVRYLFRNDSLVHNDVRADNCAWNRLLGAVKLIDWNWTQISDRRIDVNSLLIHVHRSGFDVTTQYAGRLDADALQWLEARLNLKSLVGQIEQSTGRIAELVKAVKSYSYMDQSPMQEVDIHEGIESTLTILGHKLKNVTVIRAFDRSVPRIMAYGSELNQVWTNLIDNAIAAVNGTGKICIGTSLEDNQLVVEIVDNGAGIPASRIQTASEVLDDPQLAALGQMQPLPEIGGFAPALPIELSRATWRGLEPAASASAEEKRTSFTAPSP